MKAVILAAGKGTRMGELSKETPKPLLKVLGKTLLEHKLESLPKEITEVIIVIGHLGNQIRVVLGDQHSGRNITYVVQEEQRGTADALFVCRDLLLNEKRFLVMMGDDMYSKEDMSECLIHDFSILVKETEHFDGKGAKVVFSENGNIIDILEKHVENESGFLCAGMYTMTPKIFNEKTMEIPGGEVGLPQTLLSIKDVEIKAVKASFWIQITTPEDLEKAEEFLKKNKI